MSPTQPLDVLVIGGGPAGLNTALTIAHQLHTAIVFDSGSYRNGQTSHMHTLLTWDHKDPSEFRAAARANNLSGYETVQFADVEIVRVEQTAEGIFAATDTLGET